MKIPIIILGALSAHVLCALPIVNSAGTMNVALSSNNSVIWQGKIPNKSIQFIALPSSVPSITVKLAWNEALPSHYSYIVGLQTAAHEQSLFSRIPFKNVALPIDLIPTEISQNVVPYQKNTLIDNQTSLVLHGQTGQKPSIMVAPRAAVLAAIVRRSASH